MQHIKDQNKANDFLRSHKGTASYSIAVTAKEGQTIRFPGLRWIGDLMVDGKGVVEFPDLQLVVNTFALYGAYNQRVLTPKLVEVGDLEENESGTTAYRATRGDFSVLAEYARRQAKGGNRGWVPHAKLVIEDVPYALSEWAGDAWIPIANDENYVLYYNTSTGQVRAGCRAFSSIDKAFYHWHDRYTTYVLYERNYSSRSSSAVCNRALMFALALTNLKDQLQR